MGTVYRIAVLTTAEEGRRGRTTSSQWRPKAPPKAASLQILDGVPCAALAMSAAADDEAVVSKRDAEAVVGNPDAEDSDSESGSSSSSSSSSSSHKKKSKRKGKKKGKGKKNDKKK